jgi:cation transport ATPase
MPNHSETACMGDVTENPYQTPSLAASEEANAPPTRFNARERRMIERLLWMNRLIAGCVITIGVVMPVAYSIGFASGVTGMTSAELLRFCVIMAAVLVVGIFQARNNIYAVTATGLAAISILVSMLALVIGAFFPSRSTVYLATLSCLIPPALILWPPVWVTIMAWHWRLRGVSMQALAKVKYIDVSNVLDGRA